LTGPIPWTIIIRPLLRRRRRRRRRARVCVCEWESVTRR